MLNFRENGVYPYSEIIPDIDFSDMDKDSISVGYHAGVYHIRYDVKMPECDPDFLSKDDFNFGNIEFFNISPDRLAEILVYLQWRIHLHLCCDQVTFAKLRKPGRMCYCFLFSATKYKNYTDMYKILGKDLLGDEYPGCKYTVMSTKSSYTDRRYDNVKICIKPKQSIDYSDSYFKSILYQIKYLHMFVKGTVLCAHLFRFQTEIKRFTNGCINFMITFLGPIRYGPDTENKVPCIC